MNSNTVNLKSKFNLHAVYGKKMLLFASLFFMVMLVSSFFVASNGVSFFVSGTEVDKVVKNETELVKAVNNASDKSVYVIGFSADIALKNSFEIPKGKNIVLVSVDGFWKLFGANDTDTICVIGVLTIDGIGITHNSGDIGRGVYVTECGTLDLRSGEIFGNMATYPYDCPIPGCGGGGVYNMGNFSMSGGVISGNIAGYGGGVCNKGAFVMSGGVISDNRADSMGGGVDSSGVFVMSGGKISNNRARDGGGVYNRGDDIGVTFTMVSGEILGNTANVCGGVLYRDGSFDWLGGEISGNTAKYDGADTYSLVTVFDYRHEHAGVDGGLTGKIMGDLLLPIVVTVGVVVVAVVAGLLFYHSKSRKQSSAITGEVLNLCGNLEGYV